jgi:hypothetical protein
MKEQKYKLSPFAYLAVGAIWAISIGATIFILDNSLRQLNLIENWLPFLLFLSALILPALIVTWSFIVEITTSFSPNGISRLTLLGRKRITWREIEALRIGIFYIDLKLGRSVYRIPLLMYKNPTDLINYIREQHIKGTNLL